MTEQPTARTLSPAAVEAYRFAPRPTIIVYHVGCADGETARHVFTMRFGPHLFMLAGQRNHSGWFLMLMQTLRDATEPQTVLFIDFAPQNYHQLHRLQVRRRCALMCTIVRITAVARCLRARTQQTCVNVHQQRHRILVLDHHITSRRVLLAADYPCFVRTDAVDASVASDASTAMTTSTKVGANTSADNDSSTGVCAGVYVSRGASGVFLDMNRSGVRLAWDYCFPERDVPVFVDWVEDRDLWTRRYWQSDAFDLAIQPIKYSYPHFLDYFDEHKLMRLLAIGGNLVCTRNAYIADLMTKVVRVHFEGLTWGLVECRSYVSDVGNRLVVDYERAICYRYSRQKRIYHVSLRSSPSTDVSAIAEKYGGGGHPQSSHFVTVDLSLLGIVYN
jgi:hypothetical protein